MTSTVLLKDIQLAIKSDIEKVNSANLIIQTSILIRNIHLETSLLFLFKGKQKKEKVHVSQIVLFSPFDLEVKHVSSV